MKSFLTVLMLAGCATQPATPRSAEYRQCEYEAKVATAHTGNAMQDGFRQGQLLRMCLDLKGIKS